MTPCGPRAGSSRKRRRMWRVRNAPWTHARAPRRHAMPDFALEALLAEARRELLLRQSVYPRLVRSETLPEAQAARQLALQEAIVALLMGLVALEAGQMDLFKEA